MYSTEIKASRNIWIPFYLSEVCEVCAYQCVRCAAYWLPWLAFNQRSTNTNTTWWCRQREQPKWNFAESRMSSGRERRTYNICWGLKTFRITSLATLAKIVRSHFIFLSLFWIIYCKYWDFGFKCWSPFIKSLFNWDVTQSVSPPSFTWIHRTTWNTYFCQLNSQMDKNVSQLIIYCMSLMTTRC